MILRGLRALATTDGVIAVMLLAFAAVMLVVVIPIAIQMPLTRFGTASQALSPAALPIAICFAIAGFAAAYLVRTMRRIGSEALVDENATRPRVRWRLVAIVAMSVAYIGVFQKAPFVVITPIFLLACRAALSESPTRWSLRELGGASAGAVAFSLALEAIFQRGFKVYLSP